MQVRRMHEVCIVDDCNWTTHWFGCLHDNSLSFLMLLLRLALHRVQPCHAAVQSQVVNLCLGRLSDDRADNGQFGGRHMLLKLHWSRWDEDRLFHFDLKWWQCPWLMQLFARLRVLLLQRVIIFFARDNWVRPIGLDPPGLYQMLQSRPARLGGFPIRHFSLRFGRRGLW